MTGTSATTALVTQVVVARYAWHVPFHRQVQMMAGRGIRLDRSTLAGWAKRAAWWLKPLYRLQLMAIHRQPRLFCDETRMPVLEPGLRHTHTGQFWTHAVDDRPWCGPAPPMVGYIYADGRGAMHIDGQLRGFEGVLQVDGYGAYKTLAKARPKLTLAFCLAHARRKFMAPYKAGSPVAREVLERIAEVYAVEARVRGRSAAERLAARQAESAPPIVRGAPPRHLSPSSPAFLYRARARIEQAVSKLKRFKRIALRCEKTVQNYGSSVALALGFILIKSVHKA